MERRRLSALLLLPPPLTSGLKVLAGTREARARRTIIGMSPEIWPPRKLSPAALESVHPKCRPLASNAQWASASSLLLVDSESGRASERARESKQTAAPNKFPPSPCELSLRCRGLGVAEAQKFAPPPPPSVTLWACWPARQISVAREMSARWPHFGPANWRPSANNAPKRLLLFSNFQSSRLLLFVLLLSLSLPISDRKLARRPPFCRLVCSKRAGPLGHFIHILGRPASKQEANNEPLVCTERRAGGGDKQAIGGQSHCNSNWRSFVSLSFAAAAAAAAAAASALLVSAAGDHYCRRRLFLASSSCSESSSFWLVLPSICSAGTQLLRRHSFAWCARAPVQSVGPNGKGSLLLPSSFAAIRPPWPI